MSDHRLLGTTGVHVSPLTLGTMMFGAWGNTDHDDVDPDHPPGPRRRDQRHRHRRRLRPRRVRGDRRQGPARADATTVVLATKFHGAMSDDDPNQRRQLPALDHPGGGGLAAPPADRPHRPLPGAPPASGDRHRRDARRALRPRPRGQGPLHRHVDVPALAGRGGPVGGGAPWPRAPGHRAAAVLDPGPRGRARPPARRPEARPGHAAVEPARRRAGSRGATAAARSRRRRAASSASPRGTTSTCRRTAPSWRRCTSCRTSPTRRGCR